jgi:hypothetical protein
MIPQGFPQGKVFSLDAALTAAIKSLREGAGVEEESSRANPKVVPAAGLHAEIVGDVLGELQEKFLFARTAMPPVAVIPIGILGPHHVNFEIRGQAPVDTARPGSVPFTGDDQNRVCTAGPEKCDVVPGFIDSAGCFPMRFQKQTGGVSVRHSEFNRQRGLGAFIPVTAIARDHDRRIALFPQFRSFEDSIPFTVAGKDDNGVRLDGRAVRFQQRTDASKNGGSENPERCYESRKRQQCPQSGTQRSSPELRGSMWPTVLRRK